MRTLIVGMGVQGVKRLAAAGNDAIGTVDPAKPDANFSSLFDVPRDSFDAALLCVPDESKFPLIEYLLENGKHVLVEKPLLCQNDADLTALKHLAERNSAVCYTAYNHRFEPHFSRMAELIKSRQLGEIYSIRMFYGNGTARLVRESEWRDNGAGVLTDLGSHLLDTLRFWLGEKFNPTFRLVSAHRHENRAFDHVVIASDGPPALLLEMSMLSWRNHHATDILAEKGSAHISSLCKWGPSTFTHRTRILPSGRPPEQSVTLVQEDPTWLLEYEHFASLCMAADTPNNLSNDLWINGTLANIAAEAGIECIVGGLS